MAVIKIYRPDQRGPEHGNTVTNIDEEDLPAWESQGWKKVEETSD